MEKKILILLVTFTLVLSFYPFQVKGDGENWLSGWQYRRPITINNPGSALNDYQVLVNLDTASLISAGKIRSDYGDIRFTDSDGKTQLNYWNEGYYFDDFNDNILDGWTATSGTWSISNGEVTQSSALIGEQFLVWNKVASNFVFEARQIATSGAYIGIIFRYQDINNMYMLELCTSACTANELQLWKKVAGNWIKIASVSETTPLTQWNTLRVEANGNSIKGYLNGQLKITATDTSFSSGKFGLATAVSTTGKFDDVRVAEIPTKIWVKVPSIPASSTKTIYVYYGNPTATSLSNSLLVFDNLNYAYSASWHIWDDSTCGGIFSEWVSVPPTYVKGPLVDIYIKPSSYGGFLFSICVYDSISNSWKRPYITWTEADGIWGRFNTGNSVWSVTKVAMRHTSVGWSDPTNVKFGGSTAKYASPEPTISIGNEETPSTTTTTLPQDDPCDNSGTWRKYYPYCCEGGDCRQDLSKVRGFCLDKNRYQTYIQDLELIREGSTENCVKCKNEKCCHEIRGFCYDYDSSSPTGCRSPPQGIITRACGDAGGNTCDILSNLQGCGLRESSSKLGPVYCASCVPTTPPITTTFTTTSTITTTLTTTSITTSQATTTLIITTTTPSITTTPTSTTTQVPTTTTIPTIPNLLVSHSDCYVNSLCTSEIVSSCDQPMWILLNSEGRPLDYTREFPIRYEIKTNYTPTSTGKIKAMAICFSSPEYPYPRVNTSFVEVKPRMIDCPTNCELNSQCSCTITGCNLGVVIVTIDGRVLNVDYVTSSPFTTRFVPNEIKTVNVTLYCVNPPLTSRAQIGITSTTTSTTTTTTTTTIPSTWLNGWQYRKPITINNPSSDLSNYQVLVNLNTESLISSGKMRSDCGDIRFTDSDGLTQLNYWLESGCNSDNTRIWVKVPYIPASSTKTIYVYYGNPSATSLSNGINTFLAFSLKFDGPFGGRTSLGAAHTCALLADGTAKCWGNNYDGQLGDGTFIDKNTPVTVSGLTNAVAIAGGAAHTCALLSDGTAKCWGNNYYGQLGDGTFIDKNTPVTVSGLTNAVAIAASFYHTCALLSDGTAKCWGRNDYGQLGDGTNTNKNTPVTVSGLTNAVAIAAGGYHTCALLADGTAKCWGYNGNGQLGDGTFIDKNTPVTVSGLTNAVAIAGGAAHTCALLSDGTAKCWGNNAEGQLGDGGTFIEKTTPVTVSGLTNAVAIAAGSSHTCALLSDGTVKCWGRNDYGQLGDGTFIDKNTPVTVSGLTNAVAIAASDVHTCALLSDGTAKCWGNNYDGQLGDGTFTPTAPYGKSTPVTVSNYNLGGRYDKTNGIPATIQKPPYFQDIYFIRKYTSPELTTSVRDEETLPIPATTSTTTPTTPTTLPYTTTTPLTPASTTSSTTTPTTTPHTTTTLTTTSIKEFKVREFNCVKSGNSYSCMIFYENNYGRNVYLVFFVSDTEGRTVTNSNIYTLQPGSGSTPSYTFSCSGRTGDYYIYWIVYEDSSLKNPKWWPPTNEWKRVTC
jgi:alpha-tubulin suppressor-like RCC1 family protein